ncbi:hypothetical protein PVAP13_1NG537400 [Panicum virgatum]|uniref:Uncharacterized protein n=1 Tax=Panicum virgatum TaxID=38727 RepID=A0A8T0WXV5_PANVG|nr:hypothetical protein PVAP13_1NG537400 [Panicum virgatum]
MDKLLAGSIELLCGRTRAYLPTGLQKRLLLAVLRNPNKGTCKVLTENHSWFAFFFFSNKRITLCIYGMFIL